MERAALMSVLGLGPEASTGEVRSARRFVARGLHPDAGGSASMMGEINAACDEWIAEIRRGGTGARIAPRHPAPTAAEAPPGADLGPAGVAATVGLLVLITAMVVAMAGWSEAALAAGALLGACAAAVFLVVLHRLSRWH